MILFKSSNRFKLKSRSKKIENNQETFKLIWVRLLVGNWDQLVYRYDQKKKKTK